MHKLSATVLTSFFAASSLIAQTTSADTASVRSITQALYTVISGPAGAKRDWDRMRGLFAEGAKMIVVANRPGAGPDEPPMTMRVLTVEDYIRLSGPTLEQRGFFEKEVAQRTELFGNIGHVFSTYESRANLEDEKPFQRGINSIQLMNDGKRWWIVSVMWQGETPENPLPDRYLKSGGGASPKD
ncbi:MAG: hypothetical protein KIS66_02760 [Fimbriimonadaceae bacterium]|nr:hypothetical protein [Fimbriimonadaceae bacterium]